MKNDASSVIVSTGYLLFSHTVYCLLFSILSTTSLIRRATVTYWGVGTEQQRKERPPQQQPPQRAVSPIYQKK
jgi:hypothetical protein